MTARSRALEAGRFLLAVVVACGAQSVGGAQQAQPITPMPGSPHAAPERDPGAERMAEMVAKGQNQERQKRLVNDTEKLLTLATELKTEVGKTDKNTLSVDVIKKAEEIEKLAHSVKERMKG